MSLQDEAATAAVDDPYEYLNLKPDPSVVVSAQVEIRPEGKFSLADETLELEITATVGELNEFAERLRSRGMWVDWNHAGSFKTLDELRADEDMAWLFEE